MKDNVALVTGGGQGIGSAIAGRLVKEGAIVYLCDRDQQRCEQTAEIIGSENLVPIQTDVTRKDQVEAMIEKIVGDTGRIDILVNNAGIIKDRMFHRMSEEEWDDVIDVNLKGTFTCSRAAVNHMRDRGYGRIINISSTSWKGNVGQANYAASKGGVISFTRTLALELAAKGVTANCICPGLIDTPMTRSVPEENLKRYIEHSPSKRFGQPEDVAYAVSFFAAEEAGYITGQVLYVCGGSGRW